MFSRGFLLTLTFIQHHLCHLCHLCFDGHSGRFLFVEQIWCCPVPHFLPEETGHFLGLAHCAVSHYVKQLLPEWEINTNHRLVVGSWSVFSCCLSFCHFGSQPIIIWYVFYFKNLVTCSILATINQPPLLGGGGKCCYYKSILKCVSLTTNVLQKQHTTLFIYIKGHNKTL